MLRKIGEFRGVALFTILLGVVVFAYGAVTWYLNMAGNHSYYFPAAKLIGGWIIISLGYIHLNLELLRDKKSQ